MVGGGGEGGGGEWIIRKILLKFCLIAKVGEFWLSATFHLLFG